jgi:hypothetical protein
VFYSSEKNSCETKHISFLPWISTTSFFAAENFKNKIQIMQDGSTDPLQKDSAFYSSQKILVKQNTLAFCPG